LIAIVFTTTFLCYSALTVYFLRRWRLRHKLPSLMVALLPLGWVVAAARELKWVPRWGAAPILAGAFAFGLVAVSVILWWELHQPRPFR
jgi:hypothetical protein